MEKVIGLLDIHGEIDLVKGECNCGSVAFKVNLNVSDVYVCHCSICRKSTGSGGIAVAVVENKHFSWLKGESEISYWSKPGHDWHTSFCKICGSVLPGKNDESRMYLPVGTFTSGDKKLKVAHHLFVDSKASWEKICDSGKQHPRAYES
ncbi:GFA family protein [Microbulbifer discodermiae]